MCSKLIRIIFKCNKKCHWKKMEKGDEGYNGLQVVICYLLWPMS